MTMRRYIAAAGALVFAVVLVGAGSNRVEAATSCSSISLGSNANLNGFVPFPSTNVWNTDITAAPVDANSASIISGIAGNHLHPDFSNVADGNYGIPYVVVNSNSTPMVPVKMTTYPDESDIAYYPLPANAPIEGETNNCSSDDSDRHVIVIDQKSCFAYELWQGSYCNGSWTAANGAIWDLQNYEQRPYGWTSVDAAGLPVFAGLVRYDEVASGAINHAIRFTLNLTKADANGGYFVNPATHAAGTNWGTANVMGMRLRLKANFDISGYPKDDQVILTAMKKYGLILADNGGNMFFQGAPDARWNDDDLNLLKNVDASNFDVIKTSPALPGYDSETAPQGAAPTINSFVASPSTIASGGTVTLSWATANDSYDFIDKLGGVRAPSVTANPTSTTTYTLNATNAYGRTTKSVTVTVSGSGTSTPAPTSTTPTSTQPVSRPVISSFIALPAIIALHGTSTLSWNISNASSVTIASITSSITTLKGSVTVSPTSTVTYVITAMNGGGSATASAMVTVDTTAPAVPVSLSATASGSTTVTLSWNASADSGTGVAGYSIFRCAGSSSCMPQAKVATSSSTSYKDTGLTAATAYRYAVAAYDNAGNVSANSGVVQAVTLPASSPTPSSTPNPTPTPTPTPTSTAAGAISQLLVQIENLRTQVNHAIVAMLTRSITVGSTGMDVQYLQEFLNINGFTIAQSGSGSLGSESTYFGWRTAQALQEFQSVYGIRATGRLDDATRAFLLKTF